MIQKVQFARVLDDNGAIVTPDPGEYVAQPARLVGYDGDDNAIMQEVPDKLVSNWRGTWQLDADTMVGLYAGDTLPDGVTVYAGEVPPPVYLASFDSKQLLAALLATMSSDQALIALSNAQAAAQLELLRTRTVTIHKDDAGYQAAIGGLLALGALTQAQHDDLLNGVRA